MVRPITTLRLVSVHVDRKGEHPVRTTLSGYQGWVHADGYAGFNDVFGMASKPRESGLHGAYQAQISWMCLPRRVPPSPRRPIKRIAQSVWLWRKRFGANPPEARAALRQARGQTHLR